MLKKLRNKKLQKKIWIILSILILPAFILWGSGSVIRNKEKGESAYIGKVFGRLIPSSEYKDSLEAIRTQALMQFGDKFSEMQKYFNFESQAIERITLLAEAKRRKINTTDKEIIELIENSTVFQRGSGFDDKTYQEVVRYVLHTQPRIFEEQTRQNITIAKLFKQVTDGMDVKDEEVRKEYARANEELSLYYAAAIPADFTKEIAVTEQEAEEYFTQNKLQFKQPLSFNLEYVASDSKDKIQSLLAQKDTQEHFNKLIKDMGLSIKETGLFQETAPVPGIGWSPEVLSLVSKAKVGQYLTVVQIDKMYYLFRLKEIKEPFIPDFSTTKDKVKEIVIKNKSVAIAKSKIEQCLAQLKQDFQTNPKTVDLDKTAKIFGLKSNVTNLFKYGSYIEGIGASDSFWTKAVNLKDDEISDVIALPSGFYVVKLKSRVPVDEKKFKEESAAFRQQLLMQKKQERFAEFTEELKKNVQRF